jgi:hypothetical protein
VEQALEVPNGCYKLRSGGGAKKRKSARGTR